MSSDDALSSRKRINDILANLSARLNLPTEISADQDLRKLGFKSFDMVRLMLAVEEAFNITLPAQLMTVENFSSIDAIERLVDSLAG